MVLGDPNTAELHLNQLSLPSVWKQQSVDMMTRSLKQRSNMQEHRIAYFKWNEEVRRSQYSMQLQVNEALKKKKSTLEMLIEKLTETVNNIEPTMKRLHNMKDNMGTGVEDKKALLAKNAQRIELRAQRPESELVADEAQKQLVAQEQLLREALNQQGHGLQEVIEMIAELNASFDEIKIDLADKTTALDLNTKSHEECREPTLKLPQIKFKRADTEIIGTVKLDRDVEVKLDKPDTSTLMSPNIWHGSTMKNIEDAMKVVRRARTLIENGENSNKKMEDAIALVQKFLVQALEERIQDLVSMSEEISVQQHLTQDEIQEATNTSDMLTLALDDIKEPLRISTARMNIHSKRPERELIEDDVQIELKNENYTLTSQSAFLEERKTKVTLLLQELHETREQLNHDMSCKQQCIELDSRCLQV